jgi:hypothetical protein
MMSHNARHPKETMLDLPRLVPVRRRGSSRMLSLTVAASSPSARCPAATERSRSAVRAGLWTGQIPDPRTRIKSDACRVEAEETLRSSIFCCRKPASTPRWMFAQPTEWRSGKYPVCLGVLSLYRKVRAVRMPESRSFRPTHEPSRGFGPLPPSSSTEFLRQTRPLRRPSLLARRRGCGTRWQLAPPCSRRAVSRP